MKRCTIVISDTGPISSLWVVDRLDLLVVLDMRIVVVDAIYEELTSDFSSQKAIEIKDFIDKNSPPFLVAATDIGEMERIKKLDGKHSKKNAAELAIIDFLSSEGGLDRYLTANDPVVILFENATLKAVHGPPNLHFISTAGLLLCMERFGVIASAKEIINRLPHPTKPGRMMGDARKDFDQRRKINEAALFDELWMS